MKDLSVGKVCATRSSDSNWYRSKIEAVNGECHFYVCVQIVNQINYFSLQVNMLP